RLFGKAYFSPLRISLIRWQSLPLLESIRRIHLDMQHLRKQTRKEKTYDLSSFFRSRRMVSFLSLLLVLLALPVATFLVRQGLEHGLNAAGYDSGRVEAESASLSGSGTAGYDANPSGSSTTANYIQHTYVDAGLQGTLLDYPGIKYDGIAFDNPSFQNAGDWTGQRCGHWDASHTVWTQQFNGTSNDPAYRQAIITWTKNMQSYMH